MVPVKIKKLHPSAVPPKYATKGSAGFDLAVLKEVTIPARSRVLAKTGLSLEIPEGYELQVRPRSGTSLKTALSIANSPGTIDSDYRGEIGLILENTGDVDLIVGAGERVAQGVLAAVIQAEFQEVEELSETERGTGGFGSTGK